MYALGLLASFSNRQSAVTTHRLKYRAPDHLELSQKPPLRISVALESLHRVLIGERAGQDSVKHIPPHIWPMQLADTVEVLAAEH